MELRLRLFPVVLSLALGFSSLGAEAALAADGTAAQAPRAGAPRRVVSLLPSHTEIIEALGAEDVLAGVSDVEEPGTLPGIPRVGGLKPNWEVLVSLKPDLILADVSHRRFAKDFDRLGLPVLFLAATKADDFEDVFGLIREIGGLVEKRERAEESIRACREKIARAEARIPRGASPRVYFEIWPQPAQACAPRSLQGFLLAHAGARNIVPDTRADMPIISPEWVVKESPDVILHTGVVTSREIAARPGWDRIPAVKSARVVVVDRAKFSQAAPRIADAFEELVGILYGGTP